MPLKSGWLFYIRQLGPKHTIRFILNRLFSVHHYYVMRINLSCLRPSPLSRKPPGELVLIEPADWTHIKQRFQELNGENKKELLARIRFYEQGFHNCYAVKIKGKIVYIQWIIFPFENPIID